MSIKYNVIIQKEEEWYVAKCIDNNVASQGKTVEEATKILKNSRLNIKVEGEKGIVVSQDPTFDVEVTEGTVVNVVIKEELQDGQ